MKLSVIIPTLNAEKSIEKLVLGLKQQSISPAEIIVIDSSSRDQTVRVAAELDCKTMVIEREKFDHGGTRNLGAGLSSGEILVFMTQDALPVDERLLENLVKPLADSQIAASFGRQVAKPNAAPPERFARLFNYPEKLVVKSKEDLARLGIKTFFFSNVCSAVKRREFETIGRFPEKIIMNEDMVLAAKLILEGYKIAYASEATVWHSHNYSVPQQFRRYFDIGAAMNMNRWLLKYSGTEGEGIKFVRGQLSYLMRQGQYRWLPYTLALIGAKYAGYKLGLMEHRLPRKFKRLFSLHADFWG